MISHFLDLLFPFILLCVVFVCLFLVLYSLTLFNLQHKTLLIFKYNVKQCVNPNIANGSLALHIILRTGTISPT